MSGLSGGRGSGNRFVHALSRVLGAMGANFRGLAKSPLLRETGSRPFYGCKSVVTLHCEIARKSKYMPHQGAKECARRIRQGLA